jgi:hypothetical protein
MLHIMDLSHPGTSVPKLSEITHNTTPRPRPKTRRRTVNLRSDIVYRHHQDQGDGRQVNAGLLVLVDIG